MEKDKIEKREKYILTEFKYGGTKIYEMTTEEYDLVEDILNYLNASGYNFINIENCDVYKREN